MEEGHRCIIASKKGKTVGPVQCDSQRNHQAVNMLGLFEAVLQQCIFLLLREPGPRGADAKMEKVVESDTKDRKSDGKSTIRALRDPTRALELIWDPFSGRATQLGAGFSQNALDVPRLSRGPCKGARALCTKAPQLT